MGILDKAIEAYHDIYTKSQLRTIETIMGNKNFFREECIFFDDGRVASGIKHLQNDYMTISKEIEYLKENASKSDGKEKIRGLLIRQYEILKVMCFQGSQNFNNIDNCIKWMGNIKDEFMDCLLGLKAFSEGDKEEAFEKLKEYSEQHKGFGDHFLLNKVYGELLWERGNVEMAKFYVQNAVLLCPEDIESHEMLLDIYRSVNNSDGIGIEEQIIDLLRCNIC